MNPYNPSDHNLLSRLFFDNGHYIQTPAAMLSENMDATSPDVRNVTDDRIHPQDLRRVAARRTDFETTVDGDVVIVQPSFDDEPNSSRKSSPFKQLTPGSDSQDWQTRSPQQEDGKDGNSEHRNPATPSRTSSRKHSRNLSAHFFDATSIRNSSSTDSADVLKEKHPDGRAALSRKHRRMMSNDMTNPSLAHRRINSIGNHTAVRRHQREDSIGLEMLSAAVEAAKDIQTPWEAPAALQQPQFNSSAPYEARFQSNRFSVGASPYVPPPPPPPYNMPHYHHSYPPSSYYPPGYAIAAGRSYPPPGMPHPSQLPMQYPSQHPLYPQQHAIPPKQQQPGMMYPLESSSSHAPEAATVSAKMDREVETTSKHHHQGSQTFVTTMAVGTGSKSLRATGHLRNASTNTDKNDGVPSQIDRHHHRKLSSFSSLGLGTIFNASIMSPGNDKDPHPLKKGHHRATSSTVSFLNVLDMAGMDENADETFLRNLQESSGGDYHVPAPLSASAEVASVSSSRLSDSKEPLSPTKELASGGTSKRIRRKCTVEGCLNRVVQGGLCISHGAKRKICRHPGCSKNVKKAGLCSAHGPARRRCDAPGCQKVAVQGGRCIAHGARKKLCSVLTCSKQAIISGMCKKHHDQAKANSEIGSSAASLVGGGDSFCKVVAKQEAAKKPVHKPSHTRGLSIFHDISADQVQTLLNAEAVDAPAPMDPLE